MSENSKTAVAGKASEADATRQVGDVTPWLIAVMAALLAIRLAALYVNGTDLFFDEAQYWTWSQEPAFGYYSKPPLIAWLITTTTSICGNGEACVRAGAPVVHTLTGLIVFWLANRLYGALTGALSALAFLTLPGVSLSAGIISTDVPLLFAWALALAAFWTMLQTTSWRPALILGLALGIGLNAKYAMAWFFVSVVAYLIIAPARRGILRDIRLYAALAIAALLIAPNMAWNAAHSFATFSHTADNAKWGGSLFNPLKAVEFFGAQFGVFGPILFATLLVILWRGCKTGLTGEDRYLAAFAVPLIAIVTVQAFISRAHPNWAAVSYVSATILVTSHLVRDNAWGWIKGSFALHLLLAIVLIAGTTAAGRLSLPFGAEPLARTLGWRAFADTTRAEIDAARSRSQSYAAVLTDDRSVTAELLYYMKDAPIPVLAWRSEGRPHDHYELTRPYGNESGEPVLLVATTDRAGEIRNAFSSAINLGTHTVPAGLNAGRRVTFYALRGRKPQ